MEKSKARIDYGSELKKIRKTYFPHKNQTQFAEKLNGLLPQNSVDFLDQKKISNLETGTITKNIPETLIKNLDEIFINMGYTMNRDVFNNFLTEIHTSFQDKKIKAVATIYENDNLLSKSDNKIFSYYHGKYYCIFHSTDSSDPKCIYGEMEINGGDSLNQTITKFKIIENNEVIKEYEGVFVFNTHYNMWYSILIGKKKQEVYEDFINSILLGNNIIRDENILCYYYVGDIKNAITNKTPAMFQREIFDYYDCLPINIKNKISLSSNPNLVQNTYHTIYNWLKETIKNRSKEKRLEQLKVATSKAITITVENEISKYIGGICSQDISTKEKIDTLIKKLSNITDDEVDEKIRLIYNSDAGTSVPILNYYNYLMNASKQQITSNTTCIEIKDETINFKPLYCNSNSVILKKLYQHIDELSKQLDISLSELKKYRTDYTTCDHGLVSASLFLDIIAFKEEFLKLISQHPILGLSCSGKELTDKTIESYARIAFSILLHNVYVKSSKPWGVDYTHNIDINAFAYFGALMDSLQRWGRSKQLDYSVLSLPKEHFLEDDYDISFLNSNIIITCSITSSGNMRRDINTLESYLPGASHIIKIREIEE